MNSETGKIYYCNDLESFKEEKVKAESLGQELIPMEESLLTF